MKLETTKSSKSEQRMFYKINGIFTCQDCDGAVDYARVYTDNLDVTWYCKCGYLSKVNISQERGY